MAGWGDWALQHSRSPARRAQASGVAAVLGMAATCSWWGGEFWELRSFL